MKYKHDAKKKRIKYYRNIRNPNKYIIVMQYENDRHYFYKQFLEWTNGVRNYTGCDYTKPWGTWTKIRKSSLNELLEDYTEIE